MLVVKSLTEDQRKALEKEAEKKGMTITGLIKYWAQRLIDNDGENK